MLDDLLGYFSIISDINTLTSILLFLFGIFVPGILVKDVFEKKLGNLAKSFDFSMPKIQSNSLKSAIEWMTVIIAGASIFIFSLFLSWVIISIMAYFIFNGAEQTDLLTLSVYGMSFTYCIVLFLKCKKKIYPLIPSIFGIIAMFMAFVVFTNILYPPNVVVYPIEHALNETNFTISIINYETKPIFFSHFESYCSSNKNCSSIKLLNVTSPFIIPSNSITQIEVELYPTKPGTIKLIDVKSRVIGSIPIK